MRTCRQKKYAFEKNFVFEKFEYNKIIETLLIL